MTVAKDDPNVKGTTMNILVDPKNHFQLARFDRFSSWYTVQKAISICLNYKKYIVQHDTAQYSITRERVTRPANILTRFRRCTIHHLKKTA